MAAGGGLEDTGIESHGLRFEVKRPLETPESFHKRISRAAWDEDNEVTFGTNERNWELGPQLRCKGSIHSDTWVGSAAELAECGGLAIFPVTGWWKGTTPPGTLNQQARYALIVTIETPRDRHRLVHTDCDPNWRTGRFGDRDERSVTICLLACQPWQ